MSAKKTTVLHIRISEEEKAEVEQMAITLETDVSALMRQSIRRMLAAHHEHGKRLIWPPRFDYNLGQSASELRRTEETTPQKTHLEGAA